MKQTKKSRHSKGDVNELISKLKCVKRKLNLTLLVCLSVAACLFWNLYKQRLVDPNEIAFVQEYSNYLSGRYEFNKDSNPTIILFGMMHPNKNVSYEVPGILRSQTFITMELTRLHRWHGLKTVLAEGYEHIPNAEFVHRADIDMTPHEIEQWFMKYPSELSYSLFRIKHGSVINLVGSSEKLLQNKFEDSDDEVNDRSRLFALDLENKLKGEPIIAGVIGQAHIPLILHEVLRGSAFQEKRPHVIVYLTATENDRHAQAIKDHFVPGGKLFPDVGHQFRQDFRPLFNGDSCPFRVRVSTDPEMIQKLTNIPQGKTVFAVVDIEPTYKPNLMWDEYEIKVPAWNLTCTLERDEATFLRFFEDNGSTPSVYPTTMYVTGVSGGKRKVVYSGQIIPEEWSGIEK